MTMEKGSSRWFACMLLGLLIASASSVRTVRAQQATAADAKTQDASQQDEKTKAEDEKALKKKLTAALPVLEIKRLEAEEAKYSIELRDVPLADLFRVIAHDYNLNILVDPRVYGTITASFTNVLLEEALEAIAEMNNLILEKKGKILKVSPNLVTRTFVLKHVEAAQLVKAAKAETQSAASSGTGAAAASDPAAAGTAAAAPASGGVPAPESGGFFGLLSPLGKVLLGKQQNSIMIIDYPENVAQVEDYLLVVDQRMGSKVFKLKYLKASDMLGQTESAGTAASGTSGSSSASSTSTGSGG